MALLNIWLNFSDIWSSKPPVSSFYKKIIIFFISLVNNYHLPKLILAWMLETIKKWWKCQLNFLPCFLVTSHNKNVLQCVANVKYDYNVVNMVISFHFLQELGKSLPNVHRKTSILLFEWFLSFDKEVSRCNYDFRWFYFHNIKGNGINEVLFMYKILLNHFSSPGHMLM